MPRNCGCCRATQVAIFIVLLFSFSTVFADEPDQFAKRRTPDAQQRAKLQKEINEVLDLAKASTRPEKLELVKELLRTASDTRDDSDTKFMLIDNARRAAEEAGDVELASDMIDRMATEYEFDEIALRALSIKRMAAQTHLTSTERRRIQQHGDKLIEDAITSEQYTHAIGWMRVMEDVAKKFRDTRTANQLASRQEATRKLRDQHRAYRIAMERLKTHDSDEDANLLAGKYLAFEKLEWKSAFPYLAKGSDPSLSGLAESEMDGADSHQSQMALAEKWKQFALAEDNEKVSALSLSRAAAWYQSALPGLSGLTKIRAQKGLDELLAKKIAPMRLDDDDKRTSAMPTPDVDSSPTPPRFPLLNDGIRDARWSDEKLIDVLEMVELPRDTVNGDWSLKDGALISPAKQDFARVRLPIIPPREYEILADIVPQGNDRDIQFGITAPGGYRCAVKFQAYTDRVWNGIDYVDGKACKENETWYKGQVLKPRQANRIVISVRQTGIDVEVNRRRVTRYRGGFERLSSDDRFEERERTALTFGTQSSSVSVRSFVLRPIRDPSAQSNNPYPVIGKGRSNWMRHRLDDWPQPILDADKVYLDDVPETGFHVGWGILGKHGKYAFADATEVVIGGQRFDNALVTHPVDNGTARVTYRLDGRYTKFSSEIGIGVCSRKPKKLGCTLIFEVWGDGKLLAKSDPMNRPSQRSVINADLTGVDSLVLLVRCGGKQNCAYATWMNPRISK